MSLVLVYVRAGVACVWRVCGLHVCGVAFDRSYLVISLLNFIQVNY